MSLLYEDIMSHGHQWHAYMGLGEESLLSAYIVLGQGSRGSFAECACQKCGAMMPSFCIVCLACLKAHFRIASSGFIRAHCVIRLYLR